MKPRLQMYVGSPESDPFGTYLYLELTIPGVGEFELRGSDRLDDRGDVDVLEEVQKCLNLAALTRKSLKLPCEILAEEIQAMCVDLDLKEETIREIRTLIKEFREQKGDS